MGAEDGVGEVEVADAVNEAESLTFRTAEPLALHGFDWHSGTGGFHELLEYAEGGFGAVFQEGELVFRDRRAFDADALEPEHGGWIRREEWKPRMNRCTQRG